MLFWSSNHSSNRCKSPPITSSHKTGPWNNVALLLCDATFFMRRDGAAVQVTNTVILLWQDDGGHFRSILARISLLHADCDGSCVDSGHSVMAPSLLWDNLLHTPMPKQCAGRKPKGRCRKPLRVPCDRSQQKRVRFVMKCMIEIS